MSPRLGTSELTDLLLAFIVLTVAFGIMFSGSSFLGGGSLGSLNAESFVVAAIGVGTGFLLHELAHKFVAQRYGYHAEFKADMMGLVLTIAMSFLGFIIAAPGAVVISGRPHDGGGGYEYRGPGGMDDDEYWDRLTSRRSLSRELNISIAGVVVNLIVAAIFLVLLWGHIVPWHMVGSRVVFDGILTEAAYTGLRINIVLAAFNLIPFGPLDGAKVLRANPLVWALVGLPMIGGWLLIMFAPWILNNFIFGLF